MISCWTERSSRSSYKTPDSKSSESGNKGNWVYTFRDDGRKTDFQARFVESAEKDYGEEEFQPMDVLNNPRFGYFSFCSNMDDHPKNIYLAYKERWDIEECFDYRELPTTCSR